MPPWFTIENKEKDSEKEMNNTSATSCKAGSDEEAKQSRCALDTTIYESGGTIATSGLLTLNSDYGFNNKITLTSPSSNQLLKYDATNTKWINANANLSEMADCTITTPTNTQLLQFNGTKLVNVTVSNSTTLSSLTDCSIFSISNDQLLVFTNVDTIRSYGSFILQRNKHTCTN